MQAAPGQGLSNSGNIVRFGVFEVDLRSQEVRKSGLKLRLPGQSFQALSLLLERSGEVVTREELRLALWPSDTFVDFDHGLNAAITRVREVLGDSAETPRYIETLPRRGYRFIGVLQPGSGYSPATSHDAQPPIVKQSKSRFSGIGIFWRRALVVLAGGAIAFAFLETYRALSRPEPGVSVVPFTSFPGREVAPSFSPDGNRIAFGWDGGTGNDAKGFDLYVKEVGSEHLLRLTHTPSDSMATAWSPDGRFIAFSRSRNNAAGIYLISPLGGQERKLRSVGFFNRYFNSLSWSSDGRYLAYPDAKDPNSRSKLAVLDTQKMQDIYPPLPDCMDTKTFGFARQGHKLGVACKSSRGTAEIYSIPEIGGTPRHIARLSGFTTGLTWTANGQELIVSLVLGQKPLWRVNESTGKLQPLLLGAEAVNLVALHGDRLAFDNRTLTGNIWELDLDSPNPHARQLIASTRLQGDPKFSPDGKHLVFGSSRSGFSEIWMCNSDGSDAVQLTDFRGPLTGSPDWAPDGRTIVFDSRAEWHANLYLMDIDERVPRLLHTDVTENSVPGWSRDGKSIYFRSEGGGKTGIFKVGREGGSAVLVASGDGYYPVESDDGRRLFYHLHDNQARQVVLETGEDEDVPGMPESGLVSWAPAQEGIYSLELTPQGLVMNLHDPITGKSRRLANLSADTHPAAEDRLSVSPGGHRLLFSQIEQESSDIMMVENFH